MVEIYTVCSGVSLSVVGIFGFKNVANQIDELYWNFSSFF